MAQYDTMNYGVDYDLQEEERKRREAALLAQQQAQAQDMENGANAGGMRSPMDFGDIVGSAFNQRLGAAQNRLNEATSVFTDPEAALRKRLGVQQEEPTPVKQTITTDPQTGEQTMKIEGSARDLSAANPLTPTVTGPIAPTEEQLRPQQEQFAQQFQQYRQPMPGQPPVANQQPPVAMQRQMPPPAPISPEMANRPPNIGQPPTPGPGVQVASAAPGLPRTQPAPPPRPAVPGMAALPTMAQMGMTAQAQAQAQDMENGISQQPAPWVQAANDAGTDFNKLLDVAAKHPESRDFINDKLQKSFANKTKEDQANQLFKDAAAGDVKAQNKIFQLIKPETGKPKEEVTVADYAKAYMYKRLGLDDLARDVQNKIIGKDTKFGQVTVGGSNWAVETDPSGQIIRARDDEGNYATEATLNKLRAAGQKFGQQAYSTTGGSITIPAGQPDAGEEYRTVFNSTSGKFENTIITGANAGKPYTGPAGLEKRVATAAATALNDAFIKYKSNPSIAAATEMAKTASLLSPEDYARTMKHIQDTTPAIFNEVRKTLPGGLAPSSYVNPPSGEQGGTQGAPADAAAVDRIDRSLAENQREIDRANKSTAVTPDRKAQQLQVLTDERNRLLATRQSMGGAPAVQGGGAPAGQGEAGLLKKTEQVKTDVGVAGKRSESFNKHVDENVTPDAMNGSDISSIRKQQFATFDRPGVDAGKIFGIANGAGAAPGDQRWTMFRDIISGKVSAPEDEIRQRAAALGLNREEQSAVAEYAISNAEINAKTLKSTAGGSQVSDAEQKLNQARNIDVTKVPMLGGYNAMAQSQFNGDVAKYRGDFAINSKASNTAQLEAEWRREKEKVTKMYTDMAKQRLDYMAGFGNTPAAIKEGYRRFPVPQYDSNANGGQGGWIKTKPIASYDK